MRAITMKSVLRGRLAGREMTSSSMGALSWWHEAPRPRSDEASVLFEIHGGGFALGDARKEDALCEWARERYGIHVVGLNYRLAPEHAWPAALDDVLEALSYYALHADEFGMDSSRFFLLGYSAGANLALATCLKMREDAPFRIAGCALHYPFLDAATDPADLSTSSVDVPMEMMEAFNRWYANGADPRDPTISPLFASDEQISRLPRTLLYPVVGDALYPSARKFYERLRDVGTPCSFHPVEGVYHGYVEDAANPRVYRETSLPETVASRPKGCELIAFAVLRQSLDELLGVPVNDVAFEPDSPDACEVRSRADAPEADTRNAK